MFISIYDLFNLFSTLLVILWNMQDYIDYILIIETFNNLDWIQ